MNRTLGRVVWAETNEAQIARNAATNSGRKVAQRTMTSMLAFPARESAEWRAERSSSDRGVVARICQISRSTAGRERAVTGLRRAAVSYDASRLGKGSSELPTLFS